MSTGNMTKLMRKVQFVDNSPDPENVNPDETFGHIEYVWNTIAQSLLEFSKNLEIDLDTNILTIKDASCNSTTRIEAFMEFIDATDDVIKLSISQLSEAIIPFSNVYQFNFKSSNQSIYRLIEVADIIQLINIAMNAQFQSLTSHCEKLKLENDQIYKDYANEVGTGIFLEQKISTLNQEIINCRASIIPVLSKSNTDTTKSFESQSLSQLVSTFIQCSNDSNIEINKELLNNDKKMEDLTKELENTQRSLSTIQQQYDDLQLEITTKKERRKSIKINGINSQNSLLVKTDSEISDNGSNINTNGTPPPLKRASSRSPFSSDEINQLEKDFLQLQEKLQLERQNLTDADQIIKIKNSEIQQLQHQISLLSSKKSADDLLQVENMNNNNTTTTGNGISGTSSSSNNKDLDQLIETLKLEKNKVYSLYNVQLKDNQKLQLEVEELRSQLEEDASLRDIPLFSPPRPAYTYYDPPTHEPVPLPPTTTTTSTDDNTNTTLPLPADNTNNRNNNIYLERDKLYRENRKLKDTIKQLQHENDKLQSHPLTSSFSLSQFKDCTPSSSFQSSYSISSFSAFNINSLPTASSITIDPTTTISTLTKENQKLKVQLLSKQKELQHTRNDVRKSEAIRYRVSLREISSQILQLELQLQVLDSYIINHASSSDPSDNIFSEEDSNNSGNTTNSDNTKTKEVKISKILELVKNIKENLESLQASNSNSTSHHHQERQPQRQGHNSNNSSQDSTCSYNSINTSSNDNSPTTSPLMSLPLPTPTPANNNATTALVTTTNNNNNKIKARSFSSVAIKSEKIKYLQTTFNNHNSSSYNYNYSKEYNRSYPTISNNKSNNNNNCTNNIKYSNKSTVDVTTNTDNDSNSSSSNNSILIMEQENKKLKSDINQLSQNLHQLIIKEILYQNNNKNASGSELSVSRGSYLSKLKQFTQMIDRIIEPSAVLDFSSIP